MKFTSKNPHYEYLRKKWIVRHHAIQNKFWEKHGDAVKHLALGSLGGLMLLYTPYKQQLSFPELIVSRDDVLKGYDQNVLLAEVLSDKVPGEVRPLSTVEEDNIVDILSRNFGLKVQVEISGVRLNRNYGLIGGEQHLYRYPGDNLYAHADSTSDFAKYGDAGMSSNLGAWGYFVSTKEDFKEIDKQRERYYLAVQTFLSPGFAENVQTYRDFFKFRKMLVINPKTGQAVVAVVGDAGPADWTGKHLGGSPEVMDGLGLADGPRKGSVLYFFIDDPEDKVPLGPIKVKSQA
ncbi:hypothetical protein A3I48_01015 [Candidatus Daviesbacteria bacterium RIFCSPLOWO2_02_FULL_36_7]|uniref:Uncharacterized protein n=1 Tax=Candidatus Daviesbacteria bacterium RIFCSPLOWO2_02_FULL_36_7 TaxID=1797792 RepID=A0A1F5MHZ8_9BACT|nr:MAG: hypothetical protein A3I48_01015 [Candidatus Daviesbacteria bacterium RIFCSPLOWO2_02_FULL_36_7]